MHPNVHLSFGVAVEGGLLTPVIKNACGMSLIQISEQAKGLIEKAGEIKNYLQMKWLTLLSPLLIWGCLV